MDEHRVVSGKQMMFRKRVNLLHIDDRVRAVRVGAAPGPFHGSTYAAQCGSSEVKRIRQEHSLVAAATWGPITTITVENC